MDTTGVAPGQASEASAGTEQPRIVDITPPSPTSGGDMAASVSGEGQEAQGMCDAPSRKRRLGEAVLDADEKLCASLPLPSDQRRVLTRIISSLNVEESSVVITNPLEKDNPIVYVTKPWERMCGFSYAQACGTNPRITQGEQSDRETIRLMSSALSQQRSCKVMMLNYRSGLRAQPFWNMLSISPITEGGKLMFFLANLQDYTYHMSKLVSLSPSHFCRSAEHHQMPRRCWTADELLTSRCLATPTVIEMSDDYPLAPASEGAGRNPMPLMQMKRLGWAKLTLEPEHLQTRVADCLEQMDARYEVAEPSNEDDVFVINADVKGVACRVVISRDPSEASMYRIACSRLAGDTFAYHDAFRELRTLLADAVEGSPSLSDGPGARRGLGKMGLAPAPLGLAPLPTLGASPVKAGSHSGISGMGLGVASGVTLPEAAHEGEHATGASPRV